MIFTEGMKKVELLILKRDIDPVLEYLGKARCFQASDPIQKEPSELHKKYEEHRKSLEAAVRFLGIRGLPFSEESIRAPGPADIDETGKILGEIQSLIETEKELVERKIRVEKTLEELSIFSKIDIPLKDLEGVTFLSYKIGFLNPEKIREAQNGLGSRIAIVKIDDFGRVFAISSKKGRFALDTELKKFDFKEIPIPPEVRDVPPEVRTALERDLDSINKNLEHLVTEKEKYRLLSEKRITELGENFSVGCLVEDLKDRLESTDSVFKLTGWFPVGGMNEVFSRLVKVTGSRIAIRTFNAGELDSVRTGREKVPVRLRHNRFFNAFSGIVISYGAPLYGTIDPTPVVTISFILLFAIMFGDVGQGFVGFLFGVILGREVFPGLKKWKNFSIIFKTLGLASMFTGFLYGSFFANEEALVPLTRLLTRFVFGTPMDRFISLLPTHGIEKLFVFFGFTLAVGVIINSLGLLINIYNRFYLGDYKKAIFSKTGIVGSLFFWYAVVLAVRIGFGGNIHGFDGFFLLSMLFLLFWGEPLYRLITREQPVFPEGFFSFFMEGFVEIMESLSYFISNTVSFLRVGAFALSHTVLSLIVFQMANLIGSVPGGIVLKILVIVVGNILIIVLEGLIVSIQVIRLQYYEFFSKFFTDSGVVFHPFEFTKSQQ
jgi:V/A-type H+-transporting ATPase subunit I